MFGIKIALLVCEPDLHLAILATHGDFSDIFQNWLKDSLPPKYLGKDVFLLDSFDVVHKTEYPDDINDYHAVIVTGSTSSAYMDIPWINKLVLYLREQIQHHPEIKLFGSCFGHQVIGRALGAAVEPNPMSWELAINVIALTTIGKAIFGKQTLALQQMHQDRVVPNLNSIMLVGSSSITANQGLVLFAPQIEEQVQNIQVLTVQGHPEFPASLVEVLIDTLTNTGVFTEGQRKEALLRLHTSEGTEGDGLLVGKVFWRMLGIGG